MKRPPLVSLLSLLGGLNFTFVHAQSPTVDEPCAAVSSILVAIETDSSITLPAETAFECLQTVPIIEQDALDLLDAWAAFLEWQSDPTYKANPPSSYLLPGFDYLQAVADLRESVNTGKITTELDLHEGIRDIFLSSNDGHLNIQTDFNNVFGWERQVALVSASTDGQAVPQIWAYRDVAQFVQGALAYNPSQVVSVDGQDVTEYLTSEYAKASLNQDPDAQYNYQFFTAAQSTPYLQTGGFLHPTRYPGATTTLTFENGTEFTFSNFATTGVNFNGVFDGPSFYAKFCNATRKAIDASEGSSGNGRAHPQKRRLVGRELVERQSTGLDPVVASDDASFLGFILNGNEEYSRTAVIALSSFTVDNQTQVQTLLRQFLDSCREQGVDHLVLDLHSNGGGSIIVAYDIMKQLFPNLYPYFQRTFRAQPQLDVLGEAYTDITMALLADSEGNRTAAINYYGSVKSYDITGYVDRNGAPFPSWEEFFGPVANNDDEQTRLFTWDVSDTALSTAYGRGDEYYAVTGYGVNAPAPPRPFDPENIVILSNGDCSSSCTTLSHFLKWQAKVKTLVLGGRPQTGPMQHPGGIKGGTVLEMPGVVADAVLLYESGLAPEPLLEKANSTRLPRLVALSEYLKLRTFDGTGNSVSVNYVNNMLGNEAANGNSDLWADKATVPLQYLYEAADCRMFYTANTALSRSSQWINAANQAFGFNNTEIWSGCMENSFGHESSLSGDEKLFNGGVPVNVTGFTLGSVGDGPVDVSVFDLSENPFVSEVNASSPVNGTDGAIPSETESSVEPTGNGVGKLRVETVWVTIVVGAIGVFVLF